MHSVWCSPHKTVIESIWGRVTWYVPSFCYAMSMHSGKMLKIVLHDFSFRFTHPLPDESSITLMFYVHVNISVRPFDCCLSIAKLHRWATLKQMIPNICPDYYRPRLLMPIFAIRIQGVSTYLTKCSIRLQQKLKHIDLIQWYRYDLHAIIYGMV